MCFWKKITKVFFSLTRKYLNFEISKCFKIFLIFEGTIVKIQKINIDRWLLPMHSFLVFGSFLGHSESSPEISYLFYHLSPRFLINKKEWCQHRGSRFIYQGKALKESNTTSITAPVGAPQETLMSPRETLMSPGCTPETEFSSNPKPCEDIRQTATPLQLVWFSTPKIPPQPNFLSLVCRVAPHQWLWSSR